MRNSNPTVVSTFASPLEPTLKPMAFKRASAFPAQVTAFQDSFRIAHAQKNKTQASLVNLNPYTTKTFFILFFTTKLLILLSYRLLAVSIKRPCTKTKHITTQTL